MDAFAGILLGHLAADYLLQPKQMALSKSKRSWSGFAWCVSHCLLYTLTISVFLSDWRLSTLAVVFLSHWPIDRYSLASLWLRVIGGRDIQSECLTSGVYREVQIAFACLVYAVADNTLHLIVLWLLLC